MIIIDLFVYFFFSILNALSLEEPEVGGSEVESEDLASDTTEGEEEDEDDDDDEADEAGQIASTSASITLPPPFSNNESLSSSNSSLSNIDPPSFLSPLPSSYFTSSLPPPLQPLSSLESPTSPTSTRSTLEEQEQESEIDIEPEPETLASSLYAIHRPIAARRRTITGERGEYIKEGMYTYQAFSSPRLVTSALPTLAGSVEIEEEEEVGREGFVGRDRSATVASRASGKSLMRKRKLAEKLEDIFGLEGSEEVLAGQ